MSVFVWAKLSRRRLGKIPYSRDKGASCNAMWHIAIKVNYLTHPYMLISSFSVRSAAPGSWEAKVLSINFYVPSRRLQHKCTKSTSSKICECTVRTHLSVHAYMMCLSLSFLVANYRFCSFRLKTSTKDCTTMCRVAVLLALVMTLFCTIASARLYGGYFMIKEAPIGSSTQVSSHGSMMILINFDTNGISLGMARKQDGGPNNNQPLYSDKSTWSGFYVLLRT